MGRAESNVSKIADRDVFMERARSFEKKKSTTVKLSTKTTDRDVFMGRANWIERKKK